MNFLVSRAFSPFCFLFHIQKTRNERVLNRAPPFFLRNKFPTNAHKTQMYVVRHEVNLKMFFFSCSFSIYLFIHFFWESFGVFFIKQTHMCFPFLQKR